MDKDTALSRTCDVRDAAWKTFGELEPDVLAHLINPMFTGGPAWPNTRQAFRVAHGQTGTLIASDGLADPFEDGDENQNGLGLEIYGISDSKIAEPPGSWLFQVVWNMSQQCAHHGGIAELMGQYGHLTTELHDVSIPEEYQSKFVNDAGRVCVLLGTVPEGMPASAEGPLSNILFLNAMLLTLEELEVVMSEGADGRTRVANAIAQAGLSGISSLTRKSVV